MTRRVRHILDRASGPRRPAGFSLLEILVAAAVLAAALVIVLESISSGQSAARRLQRRMAAHNVASDMLARAAAGEFPTLPSEGERLLEGGGYRWRVEAAAEGTLQRLTCTVRWRGRDEEQSIRLQRLIMEVGSEERP